MERPEINLKLEMLGNLVLQLKYFSEEFEGDEDLKILETEYDKVLASMREMRELLIEDLDEYFEYCKANNEPIYLPYWTVRKELHSSYSAIP
jgi:hypothetical protein